MKDDYAKARKLAEKAYHRAIQQGHYPYLPALDFILEKKDRCRRQRWGSWRSPLP